MDQAFFISALQAVLLCFAILAAYATCKNRALSHFAVYGVGCWFFLMKVMEHVLARRPPMDISAVCYFLFAAAAFVPVRPAKVAVAQFSSLCGLVYGVMMLCIPQVFLGRDPFGTVCYACVNHSLLLFGGLAMMGRFPFKFSDLVWTLCLLLAIIVYTEICVAEGVAEGNAVFSQIIDGSIIQVPVPDFPLTVWYYLLYYPVVFGLLGLWIAATYFLNRKFAVPKKKAGIFAV